MVYNNAPIAPNYNFGSAAIISTNGVISKQPSVTFENGKNSENFLNAPSKFPIEGISVLTHLK